MYIHKQFSQKIIFAILLVVFFMFFAVDVSAQVEIENPVQSNDFGDIVKGIARFVVRVGIPVLAFFYVFSGIKFVAAQGNEQKLAEAKQMFYWTIIGTFFIVGANVIANIIINFSKGL